MQKLKTLHLLVTTHLRVFHLIEICKYLKELLKLYVGTVANDNTQMTEENLLELIQNAEKLQKFEGIIPIWPQIVITGDTFKKLLRDTVNKRS